MPKFVAIHSFPNPGIERRVVVAQSATETPEHSVRAEIDSDTEEQAKDIAALLYAGRDGVTVIFPADAAPTNQDAPKENE